MAIQVAVSTPAPILLEIGQLDADPILVEIGEQAVPDIQVEIGGLLGPPGPRGEDAETVYPGFSYFRDASPSAPQSFNVLAGGTVYTDTDASAATSLQLYREVSGGGALPILANDILHLCGLDSAATFTLSSVFTPPGSQLIIASVANGVGVLPPVGSVCGIFVSRRGVQGIKGDPGATGSGLAWVTLTEEDFEDLATPDADTIYDVLLPGETP